MAYTQKQIDALKAVEGLNYEKAQSFAEEHGLTVRSVIAKAKALNVPYTSKLTNGTKSAKPKATVRRKSEIVEAIVELLDTPLASLEKMTAADLTALEVRLGEIMGA